MIKVDSRYSYEAEVGDVVYRISGNKEVVEYIEAKDRRIAKLEEAIKQAAALAAGSPGVGLAIYGILFGAMDE